MKILIRPILPLEPSKSAEAILRPALFLIGQ